MPNPHKYKVTFGGWYQRTTLHLSEIYDLLKLGRSKLGLNREKVKKFHRLLDLKEVTREAEHFEYVKATTNTGIEIRYFEDGLYIFDIKTNDIDSGKRVLEQYYNNVFKPAISYIFSLGAPTPKILANIKTTHPTVVSLTVKNPSKHKVDTEKFGNLYSTIPSKSITVYKTPKYILVASSTKNESIVSDLVEMQIFFREFKDQLEKYLDIHRKIWEEIDEVKNKKYIRGNEIGKTREKLESYKKTIDLIDGRIGQMGSYISTRQSISKGVGIEKNLNDQFQYKFEILRDTLAYIEDIWDMTQLHISSAIRVISELENKSTTKSIQTLQIITSIGVVSGVLSYLAKDELPKITLTGLIFFISLIIVTLLLNLIAGAFYTNSKYKLKFTKRNKEV